MIVLLDKYYLIKFILVENCQGAGRGWVKVRPQAKDQYWGFTKCPHHQNTTRFERWRKGGEELDGEREQHSEKGVSGNAGKIRCRKLALRV